MSAIRSARAALAEADSGPPDEAERRQRIRMARFRAPTRVYPGNLHRVGRP